MIEETWQNRGYDTPEKISAQVEKAKDQGYTYRHEPVSSWVTSARNTLTALPDFLEEEFPGWECVSAEEKLYENLDFTSTKFKGFIDCNLYWIWHINTFNRFQ